MTPRIPTWLLLLALGIPTVTGCGGCRAVPPPVATPAVVSVVIGDQTTICTPEQGAAAAAILGEAAGRWQADRMLPRIAPSHVLRDADGRAYQILMGSIVVGPEGSVSDRDLVQRLLAAVSS